MDNRREPPEAAMNTVIDLGAEMLVDQSTIRDPYVRLLTAAVGMKLVRGSPWVAINKRVAALFGTLPGSSARSGDRARSQKTRPDCPEIERPGAGIGCASDALTRFLRP